MTGKTTVGVALGGGSARALAHIGALKALEARSLVPGAVAGTSSGALVAALYALGMPATELEHRARSLNILEFWSQALDFGLHRASLIHGQRFQNWLDRKFFYGATFESLEVPLAIACTDINTGDLVVLREGSVAKAVVASCAFPGFFAAVPWGSHLLVDGGLVATVPFSALDGMGTTLRIGLHAGIPTAESRLVDTMRRWQASARGRRLQDKLLSVRGGNAWAGLLRGLARVQASYEQGVAAPPGALLISTNPPLSWWDFHKSPQAIDAGERVTLEALERFFPQPLLEPS